MTAILTIYKMIIPPPKYYIVLSHSFIGSVSVKIISGMSDKMPDGLSALCQTFLASVRHLSQLLTGKYQWPFLFSLSNILCVLSRSLPNMSSIFHNHRCVIHHWMFFNIKYTISHLILHSSTEVENPKKITQNNFATLIFSASTMMLH